MPKFTLNGREVEYENGETILEVCHRLDIEVPHYCWHPGLSVAGNCRICMVEVEGRGGTTIACNTGCAEGSSVRTDSERALGAQKDVMELLLINHPLDCPICDQAGECKLQEYSFEFGTGDSRFDFPKVHKPKNVRFSDKVTFDAERCILCTRCVRFGEEIDGHPELAIVNRGDHNEVSVGVGQEMTSPYQMNVIDICPVGALTSSDFRFKSRVWFLEQKRSVCGGCSRGCNVTAGMRWNRIQRLVPAENPDVNEWWMCDAGRETYRHVDTDERLGAPMVRKDGQLVEVTWEEALRAAADGLRKAGDSLFALVSARLTNEDMFLAARILDFLGTPHRDTRKREFPKDDLLRTGDGNPNEAGAAVIGLHAGESGTGLEGLADLDVSAAWICGDDLDDQPELIGKLEKLDFVLYTGFEETDTMRAAHVVLPGVTQFEKEGSFTNVNGRVQRIQACVQPPGSARPDWQILASLRERLEGVEAPRSITGVGKALAAQVPAFEGITFGKLGKYGLDLAGHEAAAPAAEGQG